MAPTDEAEQFLIKAIRGGDQRAWQQLIDRYQGRLLAFARARLRAPGEAEDVLQETFLGFLTSLAHYDASRSLETYLFAILRYKISEFLTKKKRRPESIVGFDADDDSPGIEPSTTQTPSGVVASAELDRRQADVLARILRRLIEETRDRGRLEDVQVIELLLYVGLRNKEAADRLSRDEKSVAGVKFRALASLRDYLEELDESDRAILNSEELSREATISSVWRQRRLSCLKRSTIGSYLLGVLEEPWRSYTAFHLEEIRCLTCRSNLEDLAAEQSQAPQPQLAERYFQSSVGFLSARAPSTTR